MALSYEYLNTSNRERFLTVQLTLCERSIPHRIRIRSYSTDKNAVLYTIFTDESARLLRIS